MNPSHDVKTMEAHKCTLTTTRIHIRATFESVICTNSLAELYCNLSQVLKSQRLLDLTEISGLKTAILANLG